MVPHLPRVPVPAQPVTGPMEGVPHPVEGDGDLIGGDGVGTARDVLHGLGHPQVKPDRLRSTAQPPPVRHREGVGPAVVLRAESLQPYGGCRLVHLRGDPVRDEGVRLPLDEPGVQLARHNCRMGEQPP